MVRGFMSLIWHEVPREIERILERAHPVSETCQGVAGAVRDIEIEAGQLQRLRGEVSVEILRLQGDGHAGGGKALTLPGGLHGEAVESIQLLAHVGRDALQIVVAFSSDYYPMLFAANVERDLLKIAYFKRGVIKNIEVFSPENVRLPCNLRKASRHSPVSVRYYLYRGASRELTFGEEQESRIVPEGMLVVELICPNR